MSQSCRGLIWLGLWVSWVMQTFGGGDAIPGCAWRSELLFSPLCSCDFIPRPLVLSLCRVPLSVWSPFRLCQGQVVLWFGVGMAGHCGHCYCVIPVNTLLFVSSLFHTLGNKHPCFQRLSFPSWSSKCSRKIQIGEIRSFIENLSWIPFSSRFYRIAIIWNSVNSFF